MHNIEIDYQISYRKEFDKLKNKLKLKTCEISTQIIPGLKTDSYIKINNKDFIICEFKDNSYDFKNNIQDCAKPIIQGFYYLHYFKERIGIIPKIIFIGNGNNYFLISTSKLLELLDKNTEDPTFQNAPNSAWKKCPKLFNKIINDYSKLLISIRDFKDNKLDYTYVTDKIKSILSENFSKIIFNKKSIKYGYEIFINTVIKDPKSVSSYEKISIFKDIIMNERKTAYNRSNDTIVYNNKQYPVIGNEYNDFIQLYQTDYTDEERDNILEIITSLYEDREKIEKSAFPKTANIIETMYEKLDTIFGKNWENKFYIWDPRCYTKNLTRNHKFKNLYLSNPYNNELELSKCYNKEATTFQFDFLNDDIIPVSNGGKIPDKLYDVIKNKPNELIILTDPEMGNTANGQMNNLYKNSNRNLKNLKVKNEMLTNKDINGKSSNELYNLYIYKSLTIAPYALGIFSTTTFLRSSSNEKFKNYIFDRYNLVDNFVYASEKDFSIIFSIFIDKKIEKDKKSTNILHYYKDSSNSNILEPDQDREFYTGEGNKLRALIKTIETEFIPAKIALSQCVTEQKVSTQKVAKNNYLGSLGTNTLIRTHDEDRCIFSAPYSDAPKQIVICKDNFLESAMYFAIRSVITPNKYNEADDFLVPKYFKETLEKIKYDLNITNSYDNKNKNFIDNIKDFKEFLFDCLVYSLFDPKAQQSSLRKYNGSTIDIKNEWYIMSLDETKKYFEKYQFIDGLMDIKQYGKDDSFIYKFLEREKRNISSISLKVLNSGKDIYRKSFILREKMYLHNRDYQLNTWDCGFNQLRLIFKKYDTNNTLNSFQQQIKQLQEKIKKNVYRFNFLKTI